MTRYFVLAFLVLVFVFHSAEAATLFGRVIEVNDGDVITVFNLNRPVRIKLMAIDAPEAGQPFGDVARKHLSDLVYDKNVLVEYWGIAADGSLVGRVTLSNVDVGVQMIRDGAAWFDASNQSNLSAADREIYQQSEQAARSERRGLWQAENPIAPWEFVRAQALRRNPAASLNAILPAAERRNRPASELTNLTLIGEHTTSGWVSGPKNWRQFNPPGESFSALVPDDGTQKILSFPHGIYTHEVNVYTAQDGRTVYGLIWAKGPSAGESDVTAMNRTTEEFIKGVAEGFEQVTKGTFNCELQDGRPFSTNGFSGSDFDLPSCTIPMKVRVYTRVVGSTRQLYVGAAFYLQEDTNVSRFMKSFTVEAPAIKTNRSTRGRR